MKLPKKIKKALNEILDAAFEKTLTNTVHNGEYLNPPEQWSKEAKENYDMFNNFVNEVKIKFDNFLTEV